MKVTWAFQSAAFADQEAVQRLMYAVEEIGDEVQVLTYKPFGAMLYTDIPTYRPVIAHGSIAFIKDAQRKISTAPVAWADWRTLRCTYYYPNYYEFLLQRRWMMLPFGSLPTQKELIYDTLQNETDDKAVFFRPNENTKRFSGQTVAKTMFDRWYEYVKNECDVDDITIASKPEKIGREYRLLMLDDHVVASSQYMVDGHLCVSPETPQDVKQFAEKVSTRWRPSELFVLDIAEVEDRLAVVEIGSFNCAGIYDWDVREVARCVHHVAVRDYEKENEF